MVLGLGYIYLYLYMYIEYTYIYGGSIVGDIGFRDMLANQMAMNWNMKWKPGLFNRLQRNAKECRGLITYQYRLRLFEVPYRRFIQGSKP